MDTSDSSSNTRRDVMTSFIQIGVGCVILYWCFQIIAPFLNVVVWGLLIAIALYPLHQSLTRRFGGAAKRVAITFALLGILGIAVPSWMIASSSINEATALADDLRHGTLVVPPPNEKVAEWPLVGQKVHDLWTAAAEDLEATVRQYAPQLSEAGIKLAKMALGSLFSVLGFVLSIIIAATLLLYADSGYRAACTLAHRVAGPQGQALTDLSIQTIRSVTKGVLGVAIIQSLLSAVILFLWGVPGAGLLAGAVLVLAVVQLPPLLVLGPVAVWVFSEASPVSATIFAVFAFVISISDSFLKPMFLGKGVDVPMLVILIGAIGGAMVSGILGLFVGAVVLAVGYKLMSAWIEMDEKNSA
jgi:predicted PurR-regulated permease PerM